MVQNRFRPYNKSLFVDMLMGNTYKNICKDIFIPKYRDINRKENSNDGYTALHFACKFNCIPMARLLLSHFDIDVNVKSNSGYTALDYAERHNDQEIVKLLKRKINDKNKKNINISINITCNCCFNIHSTI